MRERFDESSRNASNQGVRRDVARHYRARGDNAPPANGHASQDVRVRSDPDPVADDRHLVSHRCCTDAVLVTVGHVATQAKGHVITDPNQVARMHDGAFVYEDPVTYLNATVPSEARVAVVVPQKNVIADDECASVETRSTLHNGISADQQHALQGPSHEPTLSDPSKAWPHSARHWPTLTTLCARRF